LAVVNTVLSLAYYAPVVAATYRQRSSDLVLHGRPVPATMTVPLVVLSLGIVALGVWPGLASGLVGPAATALIGAFGG
jgi:NADH:ubiquinone oxidoreductase subunit 2 (subunit N)